MSKTIVHYIVDPSGEFWDAARLATPQRVASGPLHVAPRRLVEDLVVNCGYAGLRLSATACQVLVHVEKTRPAVLAALRSAIGSRSVPLVTSGCYDGGWAFRLHVTQDEALAHITARVDRAQRRPAGFIRARQVSEAGMARTGGRGLLAAAMDLCRSANGRLDDAFLDRFTALGNHRFLVCSWQAERRVWRIEQAGPGYEALQLNVTRHGAVTSQPSFEYGCWVHDSYLEAAVRGEPRIEEVDACVMTEDASPLRLRYRRLLAPMRDADGNSVVLSTSVCDPSIDLGA